MPTDPEAFAPALPPHLRTPNFPPITLGLIKEAKLEAQKQVPRAVVRAAIKKVRDAVRTRNVGAEAQDFFPEISRQLSMAVLGERNFVSAYAAGQIKQDLGRRGINVSEAQAGDIFHKSLIAGAAATAAFTAAVLAVPALRNARNFGIPGTTAFSIGSEATQTGLMLPLVRERKHRRTYMSIATKAGAVERNKAGQITGLAPALKPMKARIEKVKASKTMPSDKQRREVAELMRQFSGKASQIGTRNRRRRR